MIYSTYFTNIQLENRGHDGRKLCLLCGLSLSIEACRQTRQDIPFAGGQLSGLLFSEYLNTSGEITLTAERYRLFVLTLNSKTLGLFSLLPLHSFSLKTHCFCFESTALLLSLDLSLVTLLLLRKMCSQH